MNGAATQWERVRAAAAALGIPFVGATAPVVLDTPHRRWTEWVAAGCHAGMGWLAENSPVRREPGRWLAGCQSILVCGFPYPAEPSPDFPQVARFARGEDYHRVVGRRLRALLQELQRRDPDVRGRVAVDSAPLMEKPLAQAAGLGFIGRNTCLIRPGHGSYLFLGELLLNVPLPPSRPATEDCGACRRCVAACPTGALADAGVLDSRRCLAYLTVEHRGVIPAAFRGRMAGQLFGCDRCQAACPHNRGAGAAALPEFASGGDAAAPSAEELAAMSGREFQRRFGHTALARAGRRGLLRNWAALWSELPEPPDPAAKERIRRFHPAVERQIAEFEPDGGTGSGSATISG